MPFLDVPKSVAYELISALAEWLPAVLAIVLFTVAVRSLLLPLSIAAVRGERARSGLLPQVKELQRKHAKNPERLRKETAELYGSAGVSPAAGCLPAIAQWPVFFVMYQLFVSATIAGHQNLLLAHTVLGTPLGQNWVWALGAGGLPVLVFLGLFALLAVVAWVSARRMARTLQDGTPGARLLRLMPYGTVVLAAFVPLAAGVYLLTTTAWTAAERALL